MSEQVSKTERLSALVDDETEAFETRRLVDELLQSEEDRKQWERYHLIGDSLRGGMRMTAPPDLLEGVREQLAEEEPLQVAREEPAAAVARSRWFRPVAGTGVAAAVAVVTLVGMQMMGGGQPGGEAGPGMAEGEVPAAETQTARSDDAAEEASGSAAGIADSGDAPDELDPRFVRYFENHADLTGPGSSAFGRVRYTVGDE